MKYVKIIIAWLLIIGQPGVLFCDHIMMCLFSSVGHSEIFNVSDNGEIIHQYNLTLTERNVPFKMCFSPDGRWALVGYDTTPSIPNTHITTLLKVDKNDIVHVQATLDNGYNELVTISPDSKYGVYGQNLNTLRYYSDGTFFDIPTDESYLSGKYGDFSKYSGNIITNSGWPGGEVREFTLMDDGRTTTTGVVVDISPATGLKGLFVSPDGKTVIALSYIDGYEITVLKVHEEGGLSVTQQFTPLSTGPRDVDFTPDSRFALITFYDSDGEKVRSYEINEKSELTLVDAIFLPGSPGEDMAVTPDGRYCITRELIRGRSYFYVVAIDKDGYLTYLPDNDYDIPGFVSDIAFLPNVEPHGFMLY